MKSTFFKFISIFFIFTLLFPTVIYANDEENEVLEFQEIWNEVKSANAKALKEPNLNSRSAVVFDRTSKIVLFEKKAYEKRAMASTTKIMTAVIVLEQGNLNEIVEVSR